ncbi:serine hydrolase domain-containing protein [Clostridium thermarum]|uniref:serine hydrolase domain-containing protein n=1 Tax=Clostridium thermarum TaxID=1716543 RepID=UPI0013D106A9|nr:serine hydrolase domain-containing protein [Clostridium thermarum]
MLDNKAITQIKKVLRDSIQNNELAGGNLMIIKGGNEIFYHEDGFADREVKLPIKRDSIFRLYSMTKPITAAAAMILLERGEIELFDPVSKYLPGFKNQRVYEGGALETVRNEVTLKDLLSMTSGLVYPGDHRPGQETGEVFKEIEGRLFTDNPMTTLEAVNKLGKCPLLFHPGTYWEYGTSADVFGAVIEVVSGKSFGEFLRDEIFIPLNMIDTDFWVPEEKRHRLVKTYAADGKGGLTPYAGNHLGINNKMDRKAAFESGGAGLVSTIDDYAKFAKMLMNGGNLEGVQILRSKTVNYLTTAILNSAQQRGFDNWLTFAGHSYGNLMRIMTDCNKAGTLGSVGEYGWDGWLGAYFCNSPKDDLTFLFMMQKTDTGTSSLTRKLRNIIFSVLSD